MQQEPSEFDLNRALSLVETAIEGYPKAALFELAARGWTSAFQQTLACMISIRTLDEVTIPVAERLLAEAPTPARLLALPEEDLLAILAPSTFASSKAKNMRAIAQRALEVHAGELPCDEKLLLDLPGIGPKCANLVLGIAGGQAKIGVDIHVHRVVNRWGYVASSTPENTLQRLEEKVPRERWIDINRLLMPFGKFICTGRRPQCPSCPLLSMCPQIGVGESSRRPAVPAQRHAPKQNGAAPHPLSEAAP